MQVASPLGRAQAFPIAILAVTLLAVLFLIFGDGGIERVRKLKGELDDLRTQNGKIEAECRDMRRRVEAYRTSPGFIEEIAREELGMIRPDEVVIVLPQ